MPSSKGEPDDPKLREKVKEEVKAMSKGGGPGSWSAWKAGELARRYEAEGGGYIDKGDHKNKSQKGPPEKKEEGGKGEKKKDENVKEDKKGKEEKKKDEKEEKGEEKAKVKDDEGEKKSEKQEEKKDEAKTEKSTKGGKGKAGASKKK